jgi:hypothetical protein
MTIANETDFGERVSVIRTSILSSLNELQTIIDKSLPHAYAYSHVESERLRQQTRANLEAVKACEAEDRIRDLECAISMIIEKAERNPSASDVLAIARTARLPIVKADLAPASGAQVQRLVGCGSSTGGEVMIYIEDEERDRAIEALMTEAKAIGARVEIARGERDFRPNQYDRLAADALSLCLRISTALAPRTAPNAQDQGADK